MKSRVKKKISLIKLNFNNRLFKNYSIILKVIRIKKKSNFIAYIKYTNGSFAYINLLNGCFIGSVLKTFTYFYDNFFKLRPGYVLGASFVPRFSLVSNIHINSSKKPKYIRSAGTFAQVVEIDIDFDIYKIRLFNKKYIFIGRYSFITLGRNSNIWHKKIIIGKAGLSKKLGFKPVVRGVAMNAVDHPNGGRTKSNSPEKSI